MLGKTAFILMIICATSVANAKCSKVNGINKCHITKAGQIRIYDVSHRDPETVSFTLKEHQISGDLALYQDHVFDDDHYKDVVKGDFFIHNHTNNKSYIQYQLILKGKKGLIAKKTGDIMVPAGVNQRLTLGNVPLSKKEINHITSYEIKCVSSNIKLHRH